MNIFEKSERVLNNGIQDPVTRRVLMRTFLGVALPAVAAAPSLLTPEVAEAAKSVDCTTTMFHGESTVVVDRVINQMIAQGREPVTASQLVAILNDEAPTPVHRLFCLTFDDGTLPHARVITPHLQRRGVPGTFFVLDPASWWGDGAHQYVSVGDIQEMAASGMDVQSHGVSHQNLVAIKGTDRYWHDLIFSRSEMQEVLQQPVDIFCYPFGAHDATVRDDVYKSGYRGGFSTNTGSIQSQEMIYRLLRRRPS